KTLGKEFWGDGLVVSLCDSLELWKAFLAGVYRSNFESQGRLIFSIVFAAVYRSSIRECYNSNAGAWFGLCHDRIIVRWRLCVCRRAGGATNPFRPSNFPCRKVGVRFDLLVLGSYHGVFKLLKVKISAEFVRRKRGNTDPL